MDLIYLITLIAHVILGLLGVIGSYNIWLSLNKSEFPKKWLLLMGGSSAVNYLLSWLTGGYYYALHYASKVKPLIIEGEIPWAHTFFTEYKEHIFLFLPFLGMTIFLVIWLLAEEIETKPTLKRPLIFTAGITTVIGIIVTLAGVMISGAVR